MSERQANHGAEIAEHLDRIAAIIATARERLAEGKLVDLTALEEKVQDLHAAAMSAPAELAEDFVEAVAEVQQSLHVLGDEVDAQFRAFQDRYGAGTRVEAVRAYTRSPDEA